MKKQVRVRPGKGQSAVGAVVGAVFVLLGIFMVIPAFGPFGIFWTLIAAVITAGQPAERFFQKGRDKLPHRDRRGGRAGGADRAAAGTPAGAL